MCSTTVVEKRCPYYLNQENTNDLITEFSSTKLHTELLIARLKQCDLLDRSVQITSQKKRNLGFSVFYMFKDGFCYCHDL